MFRCTKKWTPFILFSLVCCLSFFFYAPNAAFAAEEYSVSYYISDTHYQRSFYADNDTALPFVNTGYQSNGQYVITYGFIDTVPFKVKFSNFTSLSSSTRTIYNGQALYVCTNSTGDATKPTSLSSTCVTVNNSFTLLSNGFSSPHWTTVFDYFLAGQLNPIPEDSISVSDVGYLQNVQNYSSVYSVTSPSNANALLERYIKFGWDSETSTGIRLSQNDHISFDLVCDIYTNPTFGQGDLLASNFKIHYGDFAAYGINGYAQTLPFCGLNLDNDSNYYTFYNAVYSAYGRSDIRIYNPRFYLTPYIRQERGNFLIGGTTRLVFDENLNTFFTGITPNTSSNGTLNSDGSFSTSENQVGTGTGNGIASSGDSYSEAVQNQNSVIQGVINGNISLDLDNLTTNLGGLLDDVKGIPSLFSSLFSWLPPWCLVLVAACIASIFLIGLIKVVIH